MLNMSKSTAMIIGFRKPALTQLHVMDIGNRGIDKILMCVVMKCGAALCHLRLDFTTWQRVMPHSSSHMRGVLL